MRIIRPLLLFLLLVFLTPQFISQPTAQAQTCDSTAYVRQLVVDVTAVDGAVKVLDGRNFPAAMTAYLQASQLRQRYEDQKQVPPCAVVLHSLIIQWYAAMQDKSALWMGLAADPANANIYRSQMTQVDSRLVTLATAANNEIIRLQATAAPVPTATPIPTAVAAVVTPQTTASADWYRVYFTSPINSDNTAFHTGAAIERALIFMIDNSQRSIEVALFEIDAPDTTAALIRAVQRGVQVRLVVDDEHAFQDPTSTINSIIAAGAQVKNDGRSALMHSKFFIFDGVSVWTGATNITRNGLYNNDNNAMLIRSPELAANFLAEFEEMFTDGKFSRADNPRLTPYQPINIGGTLIETYFSPEDGERIEQRVAELITGSRRSVRVMAFSFTLTSWGDALLAAKQRGVLVEGVFETTGSLRGQMPRLACAGANIRQDGNPSIMHHKVVIIDDEIVVMGSFNFSANARNSNSQNQLIIFNRDVAAAYNQEFQRVLAKGNLPSPNDLNCRR